MGWDTVSASVRRRESESQPKAKKKLQSIARHSRVGSPHRAPTFVAALAPARNMSHGPKGGYLVS
jgi:hypothetical protein